MKSFYEFCQHIQKHKKILNEETLGMQDPVPLSQFAAKPELSAAAAKGGQLDQNPKDDVVAATLSGSGPVSSLLPTQSTLVSDKVLNFILLNLSGQMSLQDMGAIVSGDNAIMDGHHRWAAAYAVDPSMTVSFVRIPLPLAKLISILNLYTVGTLGRMEGNPSDGESIAQAFANLIKKLQNAFTNGFSYSDKNGTSEYSPEQVQQALAKAKGANNNPELGLKQIIANVQSIPADKQKSATNLVRDEMPVINKEELADLVKNLNAGNVDHMQPLGRAVYDAIQGKSQAAVPQQPPANPAGAPATPTTAAPVAAPQMQNASTEYYGFTLKEQLSVLSGISTVDQISKKKNRRSK